MEFYLFFIFMALIILTVWIRIVRRSVDQASGKRARPGDVACSRCGEFIRAEAETCRHCSFDRTKELKVKKERLEAHRSRDEMISSDPRVKKLNSLFVPLGVIPFVLGLPIGFVALFLMYEDPGLGQLFFLLAVVLVLPIFILPVAVSRARKKVEMKLPPILLPKTKPVEESASEGGTDGKISTSKNQHQDVPARIGQNSVKPKQLAYCQQCGSKRQESAKFCGQCGAPH